MVIELIDKIKPKNNGNFPLVDAVDVLMPDGERLSEIPGILLVTLTMTEDGLSGTASHSASEIKEHMNHGDLVVGRHDNVEMIVSVVNDSYVEFLNQAKGIDGAGYQVFEDKSVKTRMYNHSHLSSDTYVICNAPQELTEGQQEQARTNIGAMSEDDVKEVLNDYTPVPVTQAEYDAMVEAGTINENTFYFIKEEPL